MYERYGCGEREVLWTAWRSFFIRVLDAEQALSSNFQNKFNEFRIAQLQIYQQINTAG